VKGVNSPTYIIYYLRLHTTSIHLLVIGILDELHHPVALGDSIGHHRLLGSKALQ